MSDDLPTELVHTSQTPAYHRLEGEDHTQYEAFVEFCRIPRSSRSIANFTRRTSYPPAVARKMMAEWHWEVRANAFDHDSLQLRPDPKTMDDEASIASQLAAASTLLDLGLRVLDTKNIALISTDKGIKLVEKGVELQRRALGQADLNVQFNVEDFSRVGKLIEELDMQIVEAEAVEEIEDDEPAPEIPM